MRSIVINIVTAQSLHHCAQRTPPQQHICNRVNIIDKTNNYVPNVNVINFISFSNSIHIINNSDNINNINNANTINIKHIIIDISISDIIKIIIIIVFIITTNQIRTSNFIVTMTPLHNGTLD